ncbi:MAG: hypothetical protein RI897_3038 [Verrucomicrobiota bacterium]
MGHDFLEFLEEALDAEGGFVERERSRKCAERFEAGAALPGFMGEETDEVEFVGGEAAGGEGGDDGAGTGDGFDAEAGLEDGADDAFAGVADSGGSGVGDERDGFALLQELEDLFCALVFVETKGAEEGFADAEVFQEEAGVAGILCGDAVAVLEDAEGACGDVFQITDGGGDEVESSGLERGG